MENAENTFKILAVSNCIDAEGIEATVNVGGLHSLVYLQLPHTSESRHSVVDGAELSESTIQAIADATEEKYTALELASLTFLGTANHIAEEVDDYIVLFDKDDVQAHCFIELHSGYSDYFNKTIYQPVDVLALDLSVRKKLQEVIDRVESSS